MTDSKHGGKREGQADQDEAYIGWKSRKKDNQIYGTAKRGKGTKKTPIIGVTERSTNRVYARVTLPDENG